MRRVQRTEIALCHARSWSGCGLFEVQFVVHTRECVEPWRIHDTSGNFYDDEGKAVAVGERIILVN